MTDALVDTSVLIDHLRGRVDAADLAIAATAHLLGAQLLTCNVKHFPMYPGLTPPY